MGHPSKFQRVSRLGSVTARHSISGRQPNVAALNRGRHLYSAVCRRSDSWGLSPRSLPVCFVSGPLGGLPSLTASYPGSAPDWRYRIPGMRWRDLVQYGVQVSSLFISGSIFTARRSYAIAILGVVILSVCLTHVCFVTNSKNLPAIFLYHMKGQSF